MLHCSTCLRAGGSTCGPDLYRVCTTVIVGPGDTLQSLSYALGTTAGTIAADNQLTGGAAISVGQPLLVDCTCHEGTLSSASEAGCATAAVSAALTVGTFVMAVIAEPALAIVSAGTHMPTQLLSLACCLSVSSFFQPTSSSRFRHSNTRTLSVCGITLTHAASNSLLTIAHAMLLLQLHTDLSHCCCLF